MVEIVHILCSDVIFVFTYSIGCLLSFYNVISKTYLLIIVIIYYLITKFSSIEKMYLQEYTITRLRGVIFF